MTLLIVFILFKIHKTHLLVQRNLKHKIFNDDKVNTIIQNFAFLLNYKRLSED